MQAKLRQTLIICLILIVAVCATVVLGACFLFQPDEATKYTVRYARGADDATGEIPAEQKYEKGAEVTLLASTTFEREGYVFTAWSYGDDTYEAEETFTMPARDVTFTALWQESSIGDSSTTVTATEVKFENGDLLFKGTAGGGVKTLVAYLYDTNENIQSYKATANIGADRTFTVRIGLAQLTAEPGNWYYLMVSVNGGAKLKVQYNKYNQNEVYKYGSRRYKWEYHEGIAVNYVNLSYAIDMDGVSVRAGKDGRVYLSVFGNYTGYTEQDFGMDMQLQANPWTVYKKAVTVNLSGNTFTVKMDVSDAAANSSGQFYTIHLIVDGNSVNVGCKNDPWIVETSATDTNKIYKLKSDYIGWGDDAYVMKVTVQSAASKITQTDYLKVNGVDVKKNYGNGATVMLRGANAGGYLVSEEWMTAIDYKDYKTANDILVNRFGEDVAQDLWGYYRSYMWTDADFKNCADMGMTVIRLPFSYMNVDYKENGNYDFSALDDFVRGAAKHGIYTILDLHGAYGSQNGQDHSGILIGKDNNDKNAASGVDFYTNAEKKAKTVALWKALAEHYKNNPAVAGFDLLNEPGVKGAVTGKTQWDFYDEMYKAIRAIDQDRIIIFESCWTGSDLPHPSQYNWENCMYSFHHYVGETDASGKAYSLDDLKAKMWERVDDLNKKNFGIPLYMGEFTCYSNGEFWEYTLNLFNEYGWHWTSWSYKTSWNMGGWGIYYNWANSPDLEKDTIADIKDKWRGISSAYANQTAFGSKKLKDIIKQALLNG